MRSRRRKGRRNRDGLWICGIAVLAAGAVFTARTEILDLVTTEIAFVLDPKQEGGEKESDQDIAERVESTDGGKETLTDGGVDLAETDERELILTRRIQMQERRLPAAEIRIRKP